MANTMQKPVILGHGSKGRIPRASWLLDQLKLVSSRLGKRPCLNEQSREK